MLGLTCTSLPPGGHIFNAQLEHGPRSYFNTVALQILLTIGLMISGTRILLIM